MGGSTTRRRAILARISAPLADHVATLSASGAEILVKMARLRVVDPPIELPSYRFSQIWRNSQNDDRAHTWLRERIAAICQLRGIGLTKA